MLDDLIILHLIEIAFILWIMLRLDKLEVKKDE